MVNSDKDRDPTHILEDKGWGQVADEEKLAKMVDEVIKNYPVQVSQFKAGKEPVLKFLKGMVMKASEGSSDPTVIEKILIKKLK